MSPLRSGAAITPRRLQKHRSSKVPDPGAAQRLFSANFFRHPHMLGSIVPSSRYLVDKVLASIDWELARVLVEYGPGVGTLTAEILRRMRDDAQLLALETNHDFVGFLRDEIPDPRLRVVQESAAQVHQVLQRLGLPSANYIVSGIPLGSMPEPVRADISEKSRDALAPGGKFLVYQFTSRTLPALRRTFDDVKRGFELRNFPPAQVFVCTNAAPARAKGSEHMDDGE